MKLTRYIVLFALCAICIPFSYADEGMWLFNNPPYKTLQDNTISAHRRLARAPAEVLGAIQ